MIVYLIYIDILGFKDLAIAISKDTGVKSSYIRKCFFADRIKNTITEEGINLLKNGPDDYLISLNSINSVFKFLSKIMQIEIPVKGYDNIPLEIAISLSDIPESDIDPIYTDEVIAELSNNIILPYREENKNNGIRLKKTFILGTKKFHDNLDFFEKEFSEFLEYNKEICLFNQNKVIERALHINFLEQIKVSKSKTYDKLSELYVPPLEYEEIKNFLEDNKIVFIIGASEYGKTYTAVNLLWEYTKIGYTPKWPQKNNINFLNAIQKDEKQIIYLEDPFGDYEYNSDKDLERKLTNRLKEIKNFGSVNIVLTSRSEVFHEFIKNSYSASDLCKFVKVIDITKPSYSFEKRKEMLLKYAEAEDCKWIQINELKNFVIERIKDETFLPTPLSIVDFVEGSVNITDKKILTEILSEKSESLSWDFSKEILKLSEEKKILLIFIFISEFNIDLIKKEFTKILDELNIEKNISFEDLVNIFLNARKIEINENKLRFSHKSYWLALEYLLKDKIFSDLFFEILEKLSKINQTSRFVSWNLYKLFNILKKDDRNNLISWLSESDDEITKENLAFFIGSNRTKLEKELSIPDRKQIILNLAITDNSHCFIVSGKLLGFPFLWMGIEECFEFLYDLFTINEDYEDVVLDILKKTPPKIDFPEKILDITKIAIEKKIDEVSQENTADPMFLIFDKKEYNNLFSRYLSIIDDYIINDILDKLK